MFCLFVDFIKFSIDNEDVARIQPSKDGFWALGGFPTDGKIQDPWKYSENSKMAPFDQRVWKIRKQ